MQYKILIVDDEPMLTELLADYLNDMGYLPYTATDSIQAMEKLKANHYFSVSEETFLKSIEKYLLHESVINKETFDTDTRFVKKGGFKTIDKKFGGHLAEIIVELNQYLYEDGGKIA